MALQQQKSKTAPVIFPGLSELKRDLVFIGILYLIILILFNKIIFSNMIFADSGDSASARSWEQVGKQIQETEKVDAIWIPNAFSGMPGFGSLAYMPHNVSYVQQAVLAIGKGLFLYSQESWIVLFYFLGGIFMYFACRVLFTGAAGQFPSFLGALTFMLNPFFIGLAETGHGSKLMALSYIPLLFLLTYTLFQRRDLLSLGLLAMAIGTSLLTNHVQMVFYGFLIIGAYALWEVIAEVKQQPKASAIKSAFFLGALLIGFAISAYVYLSVQEYAHYSIRGGGGAPGVSGGLEYDYATNWSFHPFETLTYLIPSFFGYESPYYWGWMPFTNSTHYIGLVPLFLGILALMYKRNRMTIFLAVFSLFALMLSWGKHFPLLYDTMFNYFPFFNKFRAPDMILHLIPITFGLLSLYGFQAIMEMNDKQADKERSKLFSGLRILIIALAAFLIIGFVAKDGMNSFLSDFMFKRSDDLPQLQQQYGEIQAKQILPQLYQMRYNALWDDYIKFALIGGALIGLVMAYLKKKIKPVALTLGLTVLLLVDLVILDTKYISPKPNTALEEHFTPDATVTFLQQDQSQFRVYQIGGFMDNTYIYHNLDLIGGYSPAKIKIYQEMIDSIGLHPWRGILNVPVISMLNAKYIVVPGRLPEDTSLSVVYFDQAKQLVTYANKNVMPRAWFVNEYAVPRDKRELFNRMRSPLFDPRNVALLEKEPTIKPVHSDSTSVTPVEYKSREIKYKTYSSQPSLLVLSEVYYPAGWKAYIDGAETEIYKTNYVLRSVVVPAGEHTVEMKFDPPLYQAGFDISIGAWVIAAGLIVMGIVKMRKKGKKSETV